MQGAQELRSEAHLQVRRNDESEANAADRLFTKLSKFQTKGEKKCPTASQTPVEPP
jgi:hypothetical protein